MNDKYDKKEESPGYQKAMEIKGGPGSGSFGHAGRPGKIGGGLSVGPITGRNMGADKESSFGNSDFESDNVTLSQRRKIMENINSAMDGKLIHGPGENYACTIVTNKTKSDVNKLMKKEKWKEDGSYFRKGPWSLRVSNNDPVAKENGKKTAVFVRCMPGMR